MTDNIVPFNPLDNKNLGASVAEALLARRVYPLGDVPRFVGAGIYALYYVGQFPAYAPLAARNRNNRFEVPIYVGKAIPSGARRGGGRGESGGRSLFNRLAEHAESIRAATNSLNISDFYCRFLVVEDIWIPLGESLLIAKFAPLWNTLVDGFGNHDPGRGRHQGLRPRWDVLHPGRTWATNCQERPETSQSLAQEIENYLRTNPLPTTTHIIDPDQD